MSATMTVSGLQTGYASHPSRFTETLELIRMAVDFYPAFDTTDLHHGRFVDLYLKLVWNFRDLLVLYFTMRCLRLETEPVIFDNVRLACALLYTLVNGMSDAMENRDDFTTDEYELLSFDSGEMALDEMGYLYMQYTLWVDFMFDMFQERTMEHMQATIASMDVAELETMRNAKTHLELSSSFLWAFPMPVFHVSRPVNYEISVIPSAHLLATREMRELEARMTSTTTGATTTIGFPRQVAPWVPAENLVARPRRAPEAIGERV